MVPTRAYDTNTDTTLPQFYDPLGRRFYVGVEAKFWG